MGRLSAEQLNNLDRSELVDLVLSQQEELQKLDDKLQKFMEEVADANRHRFGRSTGAFEPDGQISFCEIDGTIAVCNEAEAVDDEDVAENPAPAARPKRPQGKKAADISRLEVVKKTDYYMSAEELEKEYNNGKDYRKCLLYSDTRKSYVEHYSKFIWNSNNYKKIC